MKLIFAILFLLFIPIGLYAELFEKPHGSCRKSGGYGDPCNKKFAQYWWQEKFHEVDCKVNKLMEDLQYAVINDDYKRIEQYLKFPIKFYIDGKRLSLIHISEPTRPY